MKKIMLLCALFVGISAVAQDFPASQPTLLVGKELKILPKPSYDTDGYSNFFSKPSMYINEIYKVDGMYKTKPETLVNRIFKVVSVKPERSEYAVELQDTTTKEIVYYKYDEKSARLDFQSFEVVGGLQLPENFYCDYLTEKAVTGGKEFSTDEKINDEVKIYKKKTGAVEKYFIELRVTDFDKKEILVKRGATVNLEGGKTISRPKLLLTPVHAGGGYTAYVANIELTKEEVALLAQNSVTNKFKLADQDGIFSKYEREAVLGVMKCLPKK